MNMRILSLSSLLLITSFINANTLPYWKTKADTTKKKLDKAYETRDKELRAIYQTKEGAKYKLHYTIWSECVEFHNRFGNQEHAAICLGTNKNLRKALKDIKEIPQYKKYAVALKEEQYYHTLHFGIWKISEEHTIYNGTWNKEKAESHIKCQEHLTTQSDMFIDWPENRKDDENRAHAELHRLIEEFDNLQKNNNQN
jgi:hypothetical protein